MDAAARAVNLASADVTGVLPIANQAPQTMIGDVVGTTAASVVAVLSGIAGVVSLNDGSHINLSSTGTHATAGLIRTKYYAGTTQLWMGVNSVAASVKIVTQASNTLEFGDSDAANGWFTNLSGFSLEFNSASGSNTFYAGATLNMSLTADVLSVGSPTHQQVRLAPLVGSPTVYGAVHILANAVANSGTNYVIASDGTSTFVNAPVGTIFFQVSGNTYGSVGSGAQVLGVAARNITVSQTSGFVAITSASGEYASFGSASKDLLRLKWVDSGAGSISVDESVNTFAISQNIATTANPGRDMLVTAQAAKVAGAGNGGYLNLAGGAGDGAGLQGGVRLRLNGDNLIQVAQVVSSQRVVALNRVNTLTSTEVPSGTGDLVIYIGNVATVPTTNPVSGGVLYSDAGALKWRSPNGTVTTMGPL